MTGAASMEPGDLEKYVEKLEQRIEILAKENAALTMTLNKMMRENMKLKSEIHNLEKKLSLVDADPSVHLDPELQKE
ncbi:MAG: Initiation-control protein YabA [Methanoregulaceae archaeon PtaB.Bin152]|nr:MAG: Initiation-control protein YabA [Methanoregulaceae archaeon PtaB.Bin152]